MIKLPLLFAIGLMLTSHSLTAADSPALGQPVTAAELARWAINVFPDGTGLPPGSGTAARGENLFNTQCIGCHGPAGIGLSAPALAGAEEPLASEWPDKTIGSYWPYATTLFDFIRRAKPMDRPGSFPNDALYSLVAYLLAINGIVAFEQELNAKVLMTVKMPNREGFIPIDVED